MYFPDIRGHAQEHCSVIPSSFAMQTQQIFILPC